MIQSCQSTSAPSAPTALQRVVALLDLLDPSKPLLLHDPEHFFVHPKERGGKAHPEKKKTRVSKLPEELSDVGRTARAKLHASVFKRFVAPRYGGRYEEESHLLDMAVAFNPAMRELGYIDRLAQSPILAREVQDKIWLQIAQVAEKVIISKRAEEQMVASAKKRMVSNVLGGKRGHTTEKAGGDVCASSRKHLKMGHEEVSEAVMRTYESAGLFDKPADKPLPALEGAQASAMEEAKGLVKDWREAQVKHRLVGLCVG